MDQSSAQYQPPPPPLSADHHHHHHHQSYEAYNYTQYYQQQQQQQPYPPYYTHHNNPNNPYHNHPPQDESLIYPPGVPPPSQQIPQNQYYNYSNSTTGAVSAPVPVPVPVYVPDGTHYTHNHHHHHSREMGTLVTGHMDPPMVMDMQQHHLLEQHPKIPQGLPQPSHASTFGTVRKAVKSQGRSAKVRPPRPMAWCELCRVDCNSLEILEQHKNGKKHKKNLKVHDELQNLNKVLVEGQNEQSSAPELNPGIDNLSVKVEGSGVDPLPQENLSSQENEVEVSQQKVEESQETGKNDVESQGGRRLKRKRKKGNKGGKRMKSSDGGSRRQISPPPKPEEVVPFICELCNVKCESNVTFQSHLTGKKHLANVKRFQDQQTMIGQAALQALYPALQALYPALQELCQGDIGALVSQLQQQGGALGLQGFFPQSGPSMVFQGPAPTTSEFPQLSTAGQEQQDFQLEGEKAADEESKEPPVSESCVQSDPVTDNNEENLESKPGESVVDPVPDSNVENLESKPVESTE